MIRIKLTGVILIMLAAFSCKQEPHNKEASPNANEPSTSVKKPVASGHKEENAAKPMQMERDCNQTFDDFFKRFAKDSIFQKNRVKYPMKWFYYEGSYDELKVDVLEKEKFYYVDFTEDKDAMNREYGKYTVSIDKGLDHVDYVLKGYDNGLMLTYKFSLIDGCWYLVEILDRST